MPATIVQPPSHFVTAPRTSGGLTAFRFPHSFRIPFINQPHICFKENTKWPPLSFQGSHLQSRTTNHEPRISRDCLNRPMSCFADPRIPHLTQVKPVSSVSNYTYKWPPLSFQGGHIQSRTTNPEPRISRDCLNRPMSCFADPRIPHLTQVKPVSSASNYTYKMAAFIISRRPPSVTNHESRTANLSKLSLQSHVMMRLNHEYRS